MACPLLKTLRVSFTAPSPAPQNGYRVKWRVVGGSSYTTAIGPFVSSPALVTNVPACEDIEGTIEAVCGSVLSTVSSFTAPKEASAVCGSTVTGTIQSSVFYIYPKKLVDLQNSSDSISIDYDVSTIPNRINVYNSDDALIVSSGWKGEAAYSGPWGASISTASTGTFSFLKSAGGGDQRWYTINAEHAGNASITDSWSANIVCAAITPTYSIVPNTTSINEGETVTFNVTTTNVANGTLYYTLAGISGSDVTDNAVAGQFTITNNVGSFSKTLVNDTVTEGTEQFTASVRINSAVGEVKATSAAVNVADTSAGAPNPGGGGNGTPTYTLSQSATSVNEGGNVVFTLNTTNVVQSSTLYYSIIGSANLNASDFTDNTLTGSFIVNDQAGGVTKTLTNDVTTEGSENFTLRVHTGSPTGPIVATAGVVIVADTSLTGGVSEPTYTLGTFNASTEFITSINEGNNLTVRLETTNVPDNTNVAYVVTGITQDDLAGNSDALSGNFLVNNSFAVKNFFIAADQLTEGTETFTITLTGKGVSRNVTINDSSQTTSFNGYNLYPSLDDQACTSNGADITVYKNNSPGAILAGDTLYASQNLSDPLLSGYYSDGGYKYTVQAGGNVSSKVDCGGGSQSGSPTYAIAPNVTSVNEGGSVTFTVTTTSVADGTTLYWVTDGGMGVSAGDFSDGALTGQVTINSNTGSIVRSIVSDSSTEGAETFYLNLKTGGILGTTQATSATVTIGDTSTTPVTTFNVGVVLNGGSAGTVDCLGTSYTTATNYVTATLYDNTGTPVNATSNITVTFNQSYTPCYGGVPSTQTGTVTILAGQSSANSATWTSSTIVDCGGAGCLQETTVYECALSNSAGFNWAVGTTVCSIT